MVTVFVNEERVKMPPESTLADVLAAVKKPDQPFAVAVNATFVPRDHYGETTVAEGDRIDLVVAVQGG